MRDAGTGVVCRDGAAVCNAKEVWHFMKAPSKSIRWHHSTVSLWQGDITEHDVDAIVNAANAALAGGGGVDGAIHRAAGPQLAEACRKVRESLGGRLLDTAEPVITLGYRLPARHVIHVVGPIWGKDIPEDHYLAEAYRRCIRLAAQHGLRTVAFPSISTGAFGCPVTWAAPIDVEAILDELQQTSLEEVRLVLFSAGDLAVYTQALDEALMARGWRES